MLQSVSIMYMASAEIHSLRMVYHEWGFPHLILNDVNQLPLNCQPWPLGTLTVVFLIE